MPWKNVTPMEEKHRFITLAQSGRFTISELCESFGISRKTGHKWLTRYAEGGFEGLQEKSRAPKNVPLRTENYIERLIVSERRKHSTWGGKKIHQILKTQHDIEIPPAISTINAILKRNGLVKDRRRRGSVFKVERGSLTQADHPHHVMAVDFKGWFKTQDGERFDPLTVTDLHSRYILKAQGLPQATTRWTLQAFRTLFKREGLPEIIRVDNGAPFASVGPGGLSRLSVWWIGLGIEVQFSRPGCPQDNGSHERMHRTMKAECCKPPSRNREAQQQRMDRWKKEFNQERPHEALGQRVPAEVYQASSNRLDEQIKPDLYGPGTRTKRVSESGQISLAGYSCHVGDAFAGVNVSIEEIETTGIVKIQYANIKLGSFEIAPNARLQPPAYDERWEKKTCAQNKEKV
jgi:putative transposase